MAHVHMKSSCAADVKHSINISHVLKSIIENTPQLIQEMNFSRSIIICHCLSNGNFSASRNSKRRRKIKSSAKTQMQNRESRSCPHLPGPNGYDHIALKQRHFDMILLIWDKAHETIMQHVLFLCSYHSVTVAYLHILFESSLMCQLIILMNQFISPIIYDQYKVMLNI